MEKQIPKKTASVSIIAANYNNGQYLKDFIGSVNESTVLPKELIIIDDGSHDDSIDILNGYSNLEYLKILKFDKNRGFCKALNVGIKSATGDYIMRVDPDDMLVKDRIEKQVEFLEKNKDISVVGSNVVYFHAKTKKELFRSNFPTGHSNIKAEYLKGDHGVQHPATMIRAGVMKKYKYVQKNAKVEDYEIFSHILNDGYKFANIRKPLTKMRVHNQSISSNIKYQTIKRTFEIRDEVFKTKSTLLRIRFYYWYILNYKKFLITQNLVMKPYYLMLAVMFNPTKALKRLF